MIILFVHFPTSIPTIRFYIFTSGLTLVHLTIPLYTMCWCNGMPDFWPFTSSFNWGDHYHMVFSASRAQFLRHLVHYILPCDHPFFVSDNFIFPFHLIILVFLYLIVSPGKTIIFLFPTQLQKKLGELSKFSHISLSCMFSWYWNLTSPIFRRVFKCEVVNLRKSLD